MKRRVSKDLEGMLLAASDAAAECEMPELQRLLVAIAEAKSFGKFDDVGVENLKQNAVVVVEGKVFKCHQYGWVLIGLNEEREDEEREGHLYHYDSVAVLPPPDQVPNGLSVVVVNDSTPAHNGRYTVINSEWVG